MTRFIAMFVLCALAVGYASTTPTAQATARPSIELQAKAANDTYFDCLYARADSLAKGTGSPSDIADAALADCAREYDAYRSAVSDYFASAVSRQGQSDARARGNAGTAAARDDGRRAIVSRVLRARAPLVGLSAQATKAKASVEDPEKERLLVGDDYKALCLMVDEIYAKENRTNLTTEAMRNRTEVRLRSAGIRPIDLLENLTECTDDSKGSDRRYLQVSVTFQGNAFRVTVDFVRRVAWWVTKSDDIRSGPAATRQDIAIGIHNGNSAPIIEALDAMLDRFLNAYLKANEK